MVFSGLLGKAESMDVLIRQLETCKSLMRRAAVVRMELRQRRMAQSTLRRWQAAMWDASIRKHERSLYLSHLQVIRARDESGPIRRDGSGSASGTLARSLPI